MPAFRFGPLPYIPKHLKSVIAEKGVLQRMLVYVREVPEEEQHDMRMLQLKQSGKREITEVDTERFAKGTIHSLQRCKGKILRSRGRPV